MHFIQFNEANFDIINMYVQKYPNKFKNLAKILNSQNFQTTNSENEYKLLEPWIQWPSIYTGLGAKEHNIFRLGDVEKRQDLKNFFNEIDKMGISTGFICPMNLLNNFNNSHYFIPDPWTKTKVTGNKFIKSLYKTINFSVNNNSSGKIGLKNILIFGFSVIFFSKLKYWYKYIHLAYKAIIKKQKWAKALFLDLFIHNLNLSLQSKYKPNINVVFFNSLAHIQHHYFLNSKLVDSHIKNPDWYIKSEDDPLFDAIVLFDKIFADYINTREKIFMATALSQSPADKPVYYYRLKNHKKFLMNFKIVVNEILPRMTRDFTLNFSNKNDCLETEKKLNNIYLNNNNVFEVDNRGTSLFVTLKYSEEILNDDFFIFEKIKIKAKENISFVAIKNGIHNKVGYLYHNLNSVNDSNLKSIFQIKDFLTNNIPRNI